MAGHTEGPWRIIPANPGHDPDLGIHADGCANVLAEVYSEFRAKGEVSTEECWANARLIAAAPVLLEALKRVILDWNEDGELALSALALAIAEDAIREAEGN